MRSHHRRQFNSSLTSENEYHSPAMDSLDIKPQQKDRVAFEQPRPRNDESWDLFSPIMSRLPVSLDEDDQAQYLPANSNDYLQTGRELNIPGTLPVTEGGSGLAYTRARLPQINEQSHELWKALHSLRPVTSDYAGSFGVPAAGWAASPPHPIAPGASATDCPFVASASRHAKSALGLVRRVFNWSTIQLPAHTEGTFYGVVFRSKRASGSESSNLYEADRLAHEEAVAKGGLLMYWYGVPDPATGSNLATCIWSSRREAREASALPLHAKAAVHARRAYETFELSRYRVVKVKGETGLRLEEWHDEDEQ